MAQENNNTDEKKPTTVQYISIQAQDPDTGRTFPMTFMAPAGWDVDKFRRYIQQGKTMSDLFDLATLRISEPEDILKYANQMPEVKELAEAMKYGRDHLRDIADIDADTETGSEE